MKRTCFILLLLFVALCAEAVNVDSIRLANAPRKRFKVSDEATGYRVAVNLFGAQRMISVMRFSPKHLKTKIVCRDLENLTTAQAGESVGGLLGINGTFPHSYERVNGEDLSPTTGWVADFVDGLILIYNDRYDIVGTKDMPYYTDYSAKCDNILASGPVLIEDGVPRCHDHVTSEGSHYPERIQRLYSITHPRSVVGIDREGYVYFIVVDGRHEGVAKGFSMTQLTQVCQWLGLHEAINLDGGGSSTLWTKKYGVLNYPCDNRELDHAGLRCVRDHLIVIK